MVQDLSPRVRKLLQAHVLEAAQLLARHSNPRPQEPLSAAARALGAELLPGLSGPDGQRPQTAGARPYRTTTQDVPGMGASSSTIDLPGKASRRTLRKVASETGVGASAGPAVQGMQAGGGGSGPSNVLQAVRSGELLPPPTRD